MAIKLSEYYSAERTTQRKGNRKLASYYGDRGQGYTSASQIAADFAANIDEFPSYFRRNFIAEKLRMRYDRELALLSDALSVLQTKGLIKFNVSRNMWQNLSRTG